MLKSKLTLLSLLVFSTGAAYASKFETVTVDTHTLAPGSTAYLDFQFNPGPLASQAATVSIILFNGASHIGGSQQLAGGASGGPLPSTITIANSGSFNDAFEGVLVGNYFNFVLDFTGPAVDSPNGTATSTSEFLFSMFSDVNGTVPLLTDDPNGVLGTVTVNLDGTLKTQASTNLTFAPEPSAGWLLAGGLSLLGGLRLLAGLRRATFRLPPAL
jgi:hypothetical protein